MVKILVPVDGSTHSAGIIAHVLRMIALYKEPAELHVLHVQLPVPYANKVSHAIGHEAVDKYQEEEAELALEHPLAALVAAGIPYRLHVHQGDPPEVIVRTAGDNGCSHIFMGTHGRGGISGLLLGSVACSVLQLATVPVTVVRLE